MPVFSCPGCGARNRLPESARGRSFKCPQCGSPFSVGKTPSARVAATVPASVIPAPDDDDEDPTPSRAGLWLGVGLLAFGLLAVGGAGAAYMFVGSSRPLAAALQPAAEPEPPEAPCRVEVGDVVVGFNFVSLDKAMFFNVIGQASETDDVCLNVGIGVMGLNASRKIDFVGWSFQHEDVRLTDDLGNRYRIVDFKDTRTNPMRVGATTLYSDKPVIDVLAFQRPVPAAKRLILELPAANFGGTGVIKLRIETATLTTTAKALGKGKPKAPR